MEVNVNWEYPEKPLPLFYFKGNSENGRSLIKLLCENTGAVNRHGYIGDTEDLVYFECNGIIENMDSTVFECFKRFGLETKEIKAPEYRRFNNIFSLTAASALDTPIYLKRDEEYKKCKILDFSFERPNGSKVMVIKVMEKEGNKIVYAPTDLKKAELYY